MANCIHCAIYFDFYTSGYFIIESENIDLQIDKRYSKINDIVACMPYSSLQEVAEEWARLQHEKNIRIGLSKTTRPERLLDLYTFKMRLDEKETVSFIQRGKMTSFLQPIISLHNNEVYAYESLLRADASEKPISPGTLFQIADKTGLHSLLDQRARETAIRARGEKIKPGIKSFINFLPSTIYNPDFCLQHTFKIVEKYKIAPSDLVFEVVETEKIEDVKHLQTVLARYQKEGMKVALDDVGAGFATVDMLELLHPDYVKMDRSYIDHCDENVEKQAFLNEVVTRAHKLGIQTLAEGVERIEELQYCKSIGFDFAQGFLIGRPAETPIVNEGWKQQI